MHAFKSLVPYTNAPAIPVMHNKGLEKELLKKFDQTLNLIRQTHEVEGVFERGTTTEVANKLVEEIQPDLFVAGVKEGTAFERQTFGSNAEELIDFIETPLLLIPLDRPIQPSGSLGFASDLKNALDKTSVSTLGIIQQIMQTELLVSNIYHEGSEDDAAERMNNSAIHGSIKHIPHKHLPFFCNDPYEGLIRFTKENQIQMLGMDPHKRGFFKDLFHVSITKKLNMNSIMPFLILRENRD